MQLKLLSTIIFHGFCYRCLEINRAGNKFCSLAILASRLSVARLKMLTILCFLFDFQSMSLNEASIESLKILKQVMEEKLNATNIEVRTTSPRIVGTVTRH